MEAGQGLRVNYLRQSWPYFVLFGAVLGLYLATMPPTIYTTDSPELALGAKTLGLVHTPGYAPYILLGHLFLQLPFDDPAYGMNIFSALCIALASPLLYLALVRLFQDQSIAFAGAGAFAFSYYIWIVGITGEVYALHLLALTLTLLALILYYSERRSAYVWGVGGSFGLAVAVSPVAVLFAPALMLAFRLLRVSWRLSILSGLLSLAIFGASLLYYPLRYEAEPEINSLGQYNAAGEFERVDLQSAEGLWWLLRGKQFEQFFFPDGYFPTTTRLGEVASWLWGNYIGFGLILGLLGLVLMANMARGIGAVWLLAFLPTTYFYMQYGAEDRDTMLGVSYLLWLIPFGYGLRWIFDQIELKGWSRWVTAGILPFLLIVFNVGLVNVRDDRGFYDRAALVLDVMPQGAYVFGYWPDVMSMEYVQQVEDKRPDLSPYNLFFFEREPLRAFVDDLLAQDAEVIFLGNTLSVYLPHADYTRIPLLISEDDPVQPGAVQVKPSDGAGE